MKKTGFYIIKDSFFEDMDEPYLKGNKEGNRPHYYCFEDSVSGLYWMIPLSELHDFNGHPFKVENDMALFELMQSIENEGVIVPALARPKADGGYELIAGHRRKAACKWAGLDCMSMSFMKLWISNNVRLHCRRRTV